MWQKDYSKNFAENETKSKAVRSIFMEFCSNSSIHGIRYFTERKRHWIERIWWIIAVGLSVCLCSFSIWHMVLEWNMSPVEMCFTEQPAKISKIPFPTVTICPETKAHISKLNITSAYNSIREHRDKFRPKRGPGPESGSGSESDEDSHRGHESRPEQMMMLSNEKNERMEALSHVCQFNFPRFVRWGRNFTNSSIYDTLQYIAPTLNYSMIRCGWLNERESCSSYFTPVLTESGLCFSFNALNSHDVYTDEIAPEMMTVKDRPNVSHWSLENGYESGSKLNAYPIRVFSAKQSSALNVFLSLFDQDLEYVCRSLVPGFKIFLHTPGEIPAMSRKSFRVSVLEEAELSIRPTFVTAAVGLRSYKPEQRGCFFTNERKLRFYKTYAKTNCEAECLANFTNIECGCVQFSMPRDNRTKICGAAKINCYQRAEKRLFGEDVMDGLKDDLVKSFRSECNCLPACTSIIYDADIDRANMDWKAVLTTYHDPAFRRPGMRPTVLRIYFRVFEVETMMRSEMYTTANFLAICGGLLGLFLGVSVLSIIEFFYYSTLRLYLTLRQWRTEHGVLPFKRQAINSISQDVPNV